MSSPSLLETELKVSGEYISTEVKLKDNDLSSPRFITTRSKHEHKGIRTMTELNNFSGLKYEPKQE